MTAARTAPDDGPWLTRGVAGIGIASLLSDLGHEVPTSLLPSFLTATLGAPAAALGVIEGFADASAGVARFTGGALADDPVQRRRAAVGGYTATAVFSSLIGITTSAWQVGILRTAAWTTRGLRVPARNALLADVAPTSAYGRAYGFERAMDNLGAIGGPLLAVLLVTLVGVRCAMLVSVVPGLLVTVAIVAAIGQVHRPKDAPARRLALRMRGVLRGRLRSVFGAIGLFEVGNAAATLLILRATELLLPTHDANDAARTALFLYASYNLAATLASLVGGRLTDRSGPVRVLGLGVGCFAVAYVGFAVTNASVAPLAVCFVAAGVAIGFVETAEHAAVATYAPVEVRGSVFGLLAATQSLGNFAASVVAGLLWTLVTPEAAFLYMTGCMLGSVALLGVSATRPRE